jgi:PAS domain S-box-containing protein
MADGDNKKRRLGAGMSQDVVAVSPPYLSELLVQSIVDYAIFVLDLEGRVASWNPGAERIKGYAANEIIGQHFSRFYTQEDRAACIPQHALRTAAESGRFAAEGWRVRKDGSRFWAAVVIDAIRQDGKLFGFAKITRDMSEQRAAQLATLQSERRFRLLVQGVTDYAIFMLDTEGRVANWNAGAARIKGYRADEIVGEHFSRFYTPEDLAIRLPWTAIERARKEGKFEGEGWRVRKDGTRFWASVVLDSIHDEDGKLIGFAKITRDLTERREAQIQLERSREALFQSQKMETVGQLTGGLAHDFNNLLTGIAGSLELIKTRTAQGRYSELDRYIATAQGAASRAAALTHRLLAFARRQTLDPKPTDANKLVETMEELIRRTTGPGIVIETILAAELWPVFCDPNLLETAILNLCVNARDAMPDGGLLTIETANSSIDQAGSRERNMAAGQYVTLCVTDTGVGMERSVLDRVFDPFFTTKPKGQGTGLGLSMVYGFATQSGGQIKLDSEPGRGTTARIYLPRHRGELGAEGEEPRREDPPRSEVGETVLIVDDEPSVRMLAAEVLEELGYRTMEARDSTSGLKVLDSDTRIDLLITDVGLPGVMNGRQMADAARIKRPHLKMVFITGYADNAAISNGHLEPDMYVLIKPFTMDSLARRIREILGTAPAHVA